MAPHALSVKSTTYSPHRLLYPMKRVDFDPDGERNPQNRGKRGYERISWDEALDIVAGEIRRSEARAWRRARSAYRHRPTTSGATSATASAPAALRQPDRLHAHRRQPRQLGGLVLGRDAPLGHTARGVGVTGNYGTVEDCCRTPSMIVFWSSDPESTYGGYMGFEGTQRRLWAKQLGIEFVHIDPHYNPHRAAPRRASWIPIRPGTDAAMAIAIMYVWINEGLYDKEYVAERTSGFEKWRAYVLGDEDGVPKTPEWQEAETGVPARDVRALARAWASRKTYLAAGGRAPASAARAAAPPAAQWARGMV